MQKTDYKKEFIKTIDMFSGRYSKWQVWNDFLYLTAVSIANLFPTAEKQERESQYLEIWNKYPKELQKLFPNLIDIVAAALTENAEQDFLGTLYHELRLHQQQKGQFFTPYDISRFMAEIQFCGNDTIEMSNKQYISVNDPACGAGSLLIAFANAAKCHGINYQTDVLFVAQDIDQTAALMCYIQLSLLGCPAIIIVGDSLLKPDFHPDNSFWLTPFYQLQREKFQGTFVETAASVS